TGQKLHITNGRLAGVLEARDQLVKGYLDDIDLLAKTVIDRFNEQHEKGYTLDSTLQIGITFFTGTGAKDIAVDNNILQNLALIAASGDGTPGNGANALALSRVFHEPFTELGNVSIADYLRSIVASVGVTTQQAHSMVTSQTALVDHLHARRESGAGVLLDGELVDCDRFRQALSASARVVTAMDEALETIILRMGLVGR